MAELVDNIDGNKAELYQECKEEILEGYNLFMDSFRENKLINEKNSLEEFYILFCQCLSLDETKMFCNIFEYINIRTYSEALCETIGSLMVLAFSSGRSLHPPNLNKDIFIRYNSPPFHILHQKFIPNVTKRWIEQEQKVCKRSGDHSDRQSKKYKFKCTSSSIGNHRVNEENKTKLPLYLFE